METEVIIRPPARGTFPDLRAVWRYRDALLSMSRRKLKAEFGDLKLGMFWVLARPLLMTVIFVWFKKLSNANLGVAVPYTAYLYSGLIFWFFFAESVSRVASSVTSDMGLMQKIYFPRLISPLSGLLSLCASFLIACIPLLAIMSYYGIVPGAMLLLLPVVVGQMLLLAFGVGCIFAALITHSKDWERLLSLLLYIGLFLSPVIYAPGMLPEAAQAVHMLNPMSGILQGFRAALFADFPLPAADWGYSLAVSFMVAAFGLYCFQRAEHNFMDRL